MIHIIPILKDNYAYILEGTNKDCVIIDPGESDPVTKFIDRYTLRPVAVLNTHHHGDHVAGNANLKKRYNIPVIGPDAERSKISGMDRGVKDGDTLTICGIDLFVIATSGHTMGHVVFYAPREKALFTGDTLFSLGCGRLMEGHADDMFTSLQKIKTLPADTMIYCGHEYTQSNGRFAITEDRDNADLKARMDEVETLRRTGKPTLPVSLSAELKTNPFLKTQSPKEFAGLRARKDSF